MSDETRRWRVDRHARKPHLRIVQDARGFYTLDEALSLVLDEHRAKHAEKLLDGGAT